MAIQDISRVTISIGNLIRNELKNRYGIDGVITSAAPPDFLEKATKTVSIHLFHMVESPDFRNLELDDNRRAIPIQGTAMGLVLQYFITVINEPNADSPGPDAEQQQMLSGFVARTLHDFPVLTPDTKALDAHGQPILDQNGQPIFYLEQELRDAGDNLHLILRPAPMEETVSFWAVNQKRLARLSMFVEARIVLLEPKPAEVTSGVVLSVGDFVFPNLGPQLTATHSVIGFQPPSPDPVATLNATPARLSLFGAPATDPPGAIGDNNQITIDAVGLDGGQRILVLRSTDVEARVQIDQPFASQPAVNQQWGFTVGNGTVTFGFRRQVVSVVNGVPQTISFVPGIFGARILVEDQRFDPPRPRSSNEVGFPVTPQIVTVGPLAGVAGTYSLTIISDYLQISAREPEVELSVGGLALLRKVPNLAATPPETVPSLQAGDFGVFGGSEIRFILPAGSPTPGPGRSAALPVRLVVNGAVAPPTWLEVAA
jgi:hypothetical protein